MTKVIGVRFRQAGKVYFFSPGKFHIKQGDKVIVETARGVEFGSVVSGVKEVPDETIMQPLKSVIRIATEEDKRNEERNREKEKEAFKVCLEKIREHNLDMKLINAEYTFDNNKVLFYFTAEGRIDFRDLVKDLAAVFRTRIELRQIGVRDETKIRGGIGVCGRLMCCLKNEQDTYEYLNSKLPQEGDRVSTNDGLSGEVHSVSVLRQTVKVIVTVGKDEKEIRDYKVSEIKFKPSRRRNFSKDDLSDAEIRALEDLERKEGKSKLNDN